MTTVEVLREARGLIDTPEKWCKGIMRSGGRRCAVGAVSDVTGGEMRMRHSEADGAFRALECAAGGRRVHLLNDDPKTSHADVIAVFDRAIAAEEARDGR
jgi:hypothetical protein